MKFSKDKSAIIVFFIVDIETWKIRTLKIVLQVFLYKILYRKSYSDSENHDSENRVSSFSI